MKTQARYTVNYFMLFGGIIFDKYLNLNGWTIENVTLTDKITGTYVVVNNPECSITIDQQDNSEFTPYNGLL